ncbi:TetR-like C-terminal domain-containing protein [Pararobbsia silviterrae]|nr:TetR-like C-terminal domain-containing protein [Pararobbsia silviterrae]
MPARPPAGTEAAPEHTGLDPHARTALRVASVSQRDAVRPRSIEVAEYSRAEQHRFSIAQEAIAALLSVLQAAILDAQHASAMSQWRAMGHAFLRWAYDNPTHFEVMSKPALVDVERSGLAEGYRHIRTELRRLIAAAAADGDIYCISVEDTLVSTRAFVYGLARMQIDGHYAGWGVDAHDVLATMQRLFDSYLFRLRRTF